MKKWTKFLPLFILLGVLIVCGILCIVFPSMMKNWIYGLWGGIKAPIVMFLNVFGAKFSFYENISASNAYNLGFIMGITSWSSHKYISNVIKK